MVQFQLAAIEHTAPASVPIIMGTPASCSRRANACTFGITGTLVILWLPTRRARAQLRLVDGEYVGSKRLALKGGQDAAEIVGVIDQLVDHQSQVDRSATYFARA